MDPTGDNTSPKRSKRVCKRAAAFLLSKEDSIVTAVKMI